MISDYMKKAIAHGALNSQDLGGKSLEAAINCIIMGVKYTDKDDHLTAYIVNAITKANDLEDIEDDLNYAIFQLEQAKKGALYSKLI